MSTCTHTNRDTHIHTHMHTLTQRKRKRDKQGTLPDFHGERVGMRERQRKRERDSERERERKEINTELCRGERALTREEETDGEKSVTV